MAAADPNIDEVVRRVLARLQPAIEQAVRDVIAENVEVAPASQALSSPPDAAPEPIVPGPLDDARNAFRGRAINLITDESQLRRILREPLFFQTFNVFGTYATCTFNRPFAEGFGCFDDPASVPAQGEEMIPAAQLTDVGRNALARAKELLYALLYESSPLVQQQLQARARSAGLPQPTNKLHVAQDSIIARILSGADAIDASADPLRNASADPLRNASAAPFRNASNNDAPRFRLKMLVVVVPVAKKAVFNDLLKASSNFSAIGTWRSDAGQHNDCNAPNEVLTVEFEEARGDRISKGLCSAINAINILEANEEVLYMRIDPALMSSLSRAPYDSVAAAATSAASKEEGVVAAAAAAAAAEAAKTAAGNTAPPAAAAMAAPAAAAV